MNLDLLMIRWKLPFLQKEQTTMKKLKQVRFEEKQMSLEKVKQFTTPRKKRIRYSLEDEKPWDFPGFEERLSHMNNLIS